MVGVLVDGRDEGDVVDVVGGEDVLLEEAEEDLTRLCVAVPLFVDRLFAGHVVWIYETGQNGPRPSQDLSWYLGTGAQNILGWRIGPTSARIIARSWLNSLTSLSF